MTQVNSDVNLVGRANTNNGIAAQVDSIEGNEPYADSMTLALSSGFVQPHKIYTSQNVAVHKPKWDISFTIKQFIATMIFQESRSYYKAIIDELNRHIQTDFSFYLPVDSAGEPNWEYMNTYMGSILASAEEVVSDLRLQNMEHFSNESLNREKAKNI